MRARTILSLCCFLVLLLTGAALFAQPAPTAPAPALTSAAPFCAAPTAPTTVPLDLSAGLGGPTTQSACPAALWQQCFARWGQCSLCYCIGTSCSCENRCV